MLMDVLLIATGCSGALTLLWLGRVLHRLFRTPLGVVVHFAPGAGPIDAIVREVAAAKREVLLMAGALACRPLSQALVDARLRHVQVEVLLDAAAENDAESDLHFLVEQGLVPALVSQPSGLRGLVVIIDGKSILCGSLDLAGAEAAAGQVVLVRGHGALVASCRQQFTALRQPARTVGGMAATPTPRPEEPTKVVKEEEKPEPPQQAPLAQADDVLAAVARELAESKPAGRDEEEETAPASGPTVTKATAELFARLRKEVAASQSEEENSADKAA
jgi:hypothetical protein